MSSSKFGTAVFSFSVRRVTQFPLFLEKEFTVTCQAAETELCCLFRQQLAVLISLASALAIDTSFACLRLATADNI
jgi:hypothetical protein